MAATATKTKPENRQEDASQAEEVLQVVKSLKEEIEQLKKPVYQTDKSKPSPGQIFAQAMSEESRKEERKCGFKSLGHQLLAIREHAFGRASGDVTKQLYGVGEFVKAATGLGEAVGPDGGFLIAPQFVDGILEIAHATPNLLTRCDNYQMTSASMKIRAIDETSRASTRRGGVLGYWPDEGAALTASKPKFRQIDLTPHKVAVLMYASEELLQDAGMLNQYASRYAGEELNFQVEDALINGTGAGKPLGLLNAGCTISVSKETGQAAATIMTENIVKMWARLHASGRQNAVWLVNQDVFPQLYTMTLGVGAAGIVTYMPPMTGVKDAPPYQLMGRPVIETEYCATLGTVGDVILADLTAYISATRGSVNASSSVHVAFLTDEQVFKWTWRVAGSPWWASALTPYKGTATQSPFVTLATRS